MDLTFNAPEPSEKAKAAGIGMVTVAFSVADDENGDAGGTTPTAFVANIFSHDEAVLRVFSSLYRVPNGVDEADVLRIVNRLNQDHLLDAKIEFVEGNGMIRLRAVYRSDAETLPARPVATFLDEVFEASLHVRLVIMVALKSKAKYPESFEEGLTKLREKTSWEDGAFL
ncbi:hypothetical protein CFB44_09945 [Burkholderia sp. AU31280]|nr:hypothetical protein CFB44_09945 [Burkholderia sp. AU31280]